MLSKSEIKNFLEKTFESYGVKAYFQPPPSFKIEYPCFIYSYDELTPIYADNKTYGCIIAYTLTFITKDSEYSIPLDLLEYEGFSIVGAPYVSDNLYHFRFKYAGFKSPGVKKP